MLTRRRMVWLAVAAMASALVFALVCGASAGENARSASELQVIGTAWQEAGSELAPGEYLVRFDDGATREQVRAALGRTGLETVKTISFKPSRSFPDGLQIHLVRTGARASAEGAARSLIAERGVRYVEPNRKLYMDGGQRPEATPIDPLFWRMWGLNNTGQEFNPGNIGTPDADIDAPEGWDVRHDAAAIVVADIDTGIDVNHPDLAANIWVNADEIPGNGIDDDLNGYVDDINGWDFYSDDNILYDGNIADHWHGTHTAGTIGAVGNNALGVTGVAWNVQIMALKFLGPEGGYTDDAIEALAYAWNNGANLTSNSWGSWGPPEQALRDAMMACDIIHVCSAGNDAVDNDAGYPFFTHYPSSYPLDNIIAVAASEWKDGMAYFSCWGLTTVDLAAPGYLVLSTIPTDWPGPPQPYVFASGTSMAAPHVSGAVALLMAEFPSMPAYPGALGHVPGQTTIKDLLLASADRKPAFEGAMVSGGRLNLDNALRQATAPVIDSTSLDPLAGDLPLEVEALATAHDPNGAIVDAWWDFGDGSAAEHGFAALHTYVDAGRYPVVFSVEDDDGLVTSAPAGLVYAGIPRIAVEPDGFAVSSLPGTTVHKQLGVTNTGGSPLRFAAVSLPDVEPVSMNRASGAEGMSRDAARAVGLFEPLGRPVRKLDADAVLTSWAVPSVSLAWGCGFDGEQVWVSDAYLLRDHEFTTEGAPTGLWFDTPWAEDWAADMAWDGGYIWQVGVGSTGAGNGIYRLDPDTGYVVSAIDDPDDIWDAVSQRGLAHDPVEDVFFIGGWNQGRIYKIAGPTWPEPGKIQQVYECNLPVAGIARVGRFLVVTTNSWPDLVVVIDSLTGQQQGCFEHPGGGAYGGAGCEADDRGNVWMIYQGDFDTHDNANTAWLVDFGSLFGSLPTWLDVEPREGLLGPGETTDLDSSFSTQGLDAGTIYDTTLFIWSNAWEDECIPVPVAFSLLTAGFAWSEEEPNTATFADTSTGAGSADIVAWNWDFGDGETSDVRNPVHEYDANGHYHVTLSVTNADGIVAATEQIVIMSNTAPVADFSAEGIGPLTMQFTDASTDVDGLVVTWNWDFGDGSPASNVRNPVHVYPVGGTYNATLAVTDNDGASAAATKAVKVNALPVVHITQPLLGDLWVGERQIAWTATDADDAPETLTIALEYTDDGGATWKPIAEGEANDGSYTWDTSMVGKGGRYAVRVAATDPHGGTGKDVSGEFTIVVLARMVVASPNPASNHVAFFYQIPSDGVLYVYDIAGSLIHSADLDSGDSVYEWNLGGGGRPLANGLYLYIVITGDGRKSEVGRLVISR